MKTFVFIFFKNWERNIICIPFLETKQIIPAQPVFGIGLGVGASSQYIVYVFGSSTSVVLIISPSRDNPNLFQPHDLMKFTNG